MKTKLLALFMVVALLSNVFVITSAVNTSATWDGTVSDSFLSGSGSEADPYIIESAAQLAYLANEVNSGNSFKGKYIKLKNSISLNDENFTFDADTGLVKVTDGENTAYIGTGFNGDNSGSSITFDKTASTANAWYASTASTAESSYDGSINEWTPIGTSTNSAFKGTFDGNGNTVYGLYISSDNDYCGLFGAISGTVKNVNIAMSYVKGNAYVGAVVGYNDNGSVTNCINSGCVLGTDSYTAGVVGYNTGIADTCFNKGAVFGNYSTGGVVAYNYKTALNCTNSGYVFGLDTVGGIAGENEYGTIESSNNSGSIWGVYTVGGIAGYNYTKIINCANTGSVFSADHHVGGIVGLNGDGTVDCCYNAGGVSGLTSVGGVAGYSYGKIYNSYNMGNVVCNDKNVGGIVGDNYDTVTNCYNSGAVVGNSYVGGVVGQNFDGGTVSSCYNSGTVLGSSNVGSVAGYSTSKFSSCYFLEGCATNETGAVQVGMGSMTNNSFVNSVISLNKDEMTAAGSFVGFDFDSVWFIDAKSEFAYPQLTDNPHKVSSENVPDEPVDPDQPDDPVDPDDPDDSDDSDDSNVPGKEWDGTASDSFASGTGRLADPYIIITAEQLAYFANEVNRGNDFNGKYIKLTANICLNTEKFTVDESTGLIKVTDGVKLNEWISIGTPDNPFKGIFDGNGKKIVGLFINNDSNDQGLFGVNSGTIKNLGISSSYVKGSSNVGGIAGINDGGKIINCKNEATVIGNENAGGIVGENRTGSTISESSNHGYVLAADCYTGGIAGYNSGTVDNCFNTSNNISDVFGTSNLYAIGGIAGNNYHGSIINSYNDNSIVGFDSAGGIVGENNYGTIQNCYNKGNISSDYTAGGIAGSNNSNILNCYNTGSISGTIHQTGGIVGLNGDGTIDGCSNIGTISGDLSVGGIVGYNYGKVTSCCNGGSVSGKDIIAGIVGDNYDTVKNCCNLGKIKGTSTVGGVVGENFDGGVVSYCYNAGDVSGKNMVGAVTGHSTSKFTSCYYLEGSAKDLSGNAQKGMGSQTKAEFANSVTSLTRDKMVLISSFTGFDFDSVWTMTYDYQYPILISSLYPVSFSFTTSDKFEYYDHETQDFSSVSLTVTLPDGSDVRIKHLPGLHVDSFYEIGQHEITVHFGAFTTSFIISVSHDFVDDLVNPSCTESVIRIRKCACGATEREILKPLGHDFAEQFTIDKPATSTEYGQKSRHCSRCDAITDVVNMSKVIDTTKVYKDVKKNAWYKASVDYVVTNGLMNGMTDNSFAPNETMNRAMLITVLWRIDGEPAPKSKAPFTDLKQAWYRDAVAWAYENKIVTGTSDTLFSPTGSITREQMATILYRYSEYRGDSISERADLSVYPDVKKVHSYAYEAFSWANAVGLITGTTGSDGVVRLQPRASATRAQVATIFMRYCEK